MQKLIQNLEYVGSYSTLQNSPKPILSYGAVTYSPKQKELYSRLLVGKKAYEHDMWYAMNQAKKKRVLSQHKKAQQILNLWKQEIMLATVMIPKEIKSTLGISKLFHTMTKDIKPDPKFKCKLSFRDLNITKEMIIQKFISEKILPSNFSTL